MNAILLSELIRFSDSRLQNGGGAATRVSELLGRNSDAAGRLDEGEEIDRLIPAIGSVTGTARSQLLQRFGIHLFHRFAALYPVFVEGAESACAFLAGIERLRDEIAGLYPDINLPLIEVGRGPSGGLELCCDSRRMPPDLAAGLIVGCAEHFASPIDVERHDATDGAERTVRFLVRRRAP